MSSAEEDRYKELARELARTKPAQRIEEEEVAACENCTDTRAQPDTLEPIYSAFEMRPWRAGRGPSLDDHIDALGNIYPSANPCVNPLQDAVGYFLFFMAFITVAGNGLVLIAISYNQQLKQGVTNCFVSSLAFADLLMGLSVMPPGAALILNGSWHFGSSACALWNSLDVLCATASIETLCVIAIDRYVAITSPLRYQSVLTRRRAYILIICVWTVAGTLSFPPIYLGWWRSDDPAAQVCYDDPTCCDFITSKSFAIVGSLVSFYIPLAVIIFVYAQVLRVAERQPIF
uniref:beta-1 adrenergic receptor-like n=1 Tax=Myxine glutinosa TaxID=7769 RepID=UPI00358E3A12